MKISTFCESLIKIKKDNLNFLGIKVFNKSKPDKSNLAKIKEEDFGIIFDNDKCSKWEISGTLEHHGRYKYGEFINGNSLSDIIKHSKKDVDNILKLINGLINYIAETSSFPKIQTNGIIFVKKNGIFFLPPNLMLKNLNTLTEKQRINIYEIFNHPDLKDEENLSYGLGIISYIIITGDSPFRSNKESELRDHIRNKQILPPKYIIPELNEDISDFISAAITGKNRGRPTIIKWKEKVSSWKKKGITSLLSKDEKIKILKKGKKFAAKTNLHILIKNTFRKYGKVFIVIIFCTVLLCITAFTIISNILAPPLTMNMPPSEVVNSFYSAQNEFNHELIDDCLTDGAGKKIVNEIQFLFISSRFAGVYEKNQDSIIIAQTWLDNGKPEICSTCTIYGIANLNITKESDSIFLVEYDKFYPDEMENIDSPYASKVFHKKEKLYLKNKGDFWAIYKIEEIEFLELTDFIF